MFILELGELLSFGLANQEETGPMNRKQNRGGKGFKFRTKIQTFPIHFLASVMTTRDMYFKSFLITPFFSHSVIQTLGD